MPIPEEEGHGEGGMRVRPGRIEVHVDGKRAGPPDGDGREKRPAFVDVLPHETERKEQSKKTVDRRSERHGDAIGSGEAVRGDGRTQGARDQDAGVSQKKKRGPEDGGADGEVVVEMAGGRSKVGFGLAVFVEARPAEAGVGVLIVLREIETVLNQRSPGKSVVTDAIAAHPRIEEREREKKQKKQQALGLASASGGRWAEVLLVHERGTRRKLLLSPATIVKGQHHDVERNSQDRGRDLVTANNRGSIVPHDVISELDIRELERVAFRRVGGETRRMNTIVVRGPSQRLLNTSTVTRLH